MRIIRDEPGDQPESRPTETRAWREQPRSRRLIWIVVPLLLLLVGVAYCRHRQKAAGAATADAEAVVAVQVARVERSSIANEVTAVGTVAAQHEAAVSSKVAAPIAWMPLLKNKSVHAGEILARLESRDLSAQRGEAAAALDEARLNVHDTANGAIPLTNAQDRKSLGDARANVENARRTYARRKVLFDQGGISKKDLEASELALTTAEDDLRLAERSVAAHSAATNPDALGTAQAKVRQASDHLAAVNAQLSYTEIRAPFDGFVTEQTQYQGEFATPGAKLLTIVDTRNLIVKATVAEEVAAGLKVGDVVTVIAESLPGGRAPGRLSMVGRGADAQSRGVEVWVTLPNGGGALRANSSATILLAADTHAQSLVVPASAVTLDATTGNSGTVMVVDASSVAHEVKVTVGHHTADRMEILTGLKEGQLVVTEGNYGLPDGTKVETKSGSGAGGSAAESSTSKQ